MANATYYLRRSAATAMGAGLVGLSGWFSYAHSGDVTGPIAAIVGATGLGEAAIALYQPLMLPVWLELSGLVLLTYGLSPIGPVQRRKAVARKRTLHRFKASVGKPALKVVQGPSAP